MPSKPLKSGRHIKSETPEVDLADDLTHSQAGVELRIHFREFGDPAPLGLCAFALTTFLLSLINLQARNVLVPNVIIGVALAYGGLAQFAAGMWEFACGKTFEAVVFTSYSTFWISYAFILIPFFNVFDAYAENPQEFNNAIGHYLVGWLIFTVLMSIAAFRSNIVSFSLFLSVIVTLAMLIIGFYRGYDLVFIRIAGGSGLAVAFLAWYDAFAKIWNHKNSWITLPMGTFPWAENGKWNPKRNGYQ